MIIPFFAPGEKLRPHNVIYFYQNHSQSHGYYVASFSSTIMASRIVSYLHGVRCCHRGEEKACDLVFTLRVQSSSVGMKSKSPRDSSRQLQGSASRSGGCQGVGPGCKTFINK